MEEMEVKIFNVIFLILIFILVLFDLDALFWKKCLVFPNPFSVLHLFPN